MTKHFLSLASCKSILHESELRVSQEAAEELRAFLEEHISGVASRAVSAAKHAGRRTVLESDVKFVVQ